MGHMYKDSHASILIRNHMLLLSISYVKINFIWVALCIFDVLAKLGI